MCLSFIGRAVLDPLVVSAAPYSKTAVQSPCALRERSCRSGVLLEPEYELALWRLPGSPLLIQQPAVGVLKSIQGLGLPH